MTPPEGRGTAPLSDDASLAVSGQIHLANASAFFKNGQLFSWDDTYGNTALGRQALADAGAVFGNTAVGRSALRYAEYLSSMTPDGGSLNTAVGDLALARNISGYMNTATGANALTDNGHGHQNVAAGFNALTNTTYGNQNTATGTYALYGNTVGSRNTATGFGALEGGASGYDNTAVGATALRNNSTGDRNVALGMKALLTNTSGNGNTAIGFGAGSSLAGNSQSNILINNAGNGIESHTLRIGQSTIDDEDAEPFPEHALEKAFIHGIRGKPPGAADAIAVVIDSNGLLGTVSSSRALKQDISDVGELAERLLELRPVAFRYKQHAASDPETPLQFGLIAEEVAEVFPELVVFDAVGKPETVKYRWPDRRRGGRVPARPGSSRALLMSSSANEPRRSLRVLPAIAYCTQYERSPERRSRSPKPGESSSK